MNTLEIYQEAVVSEEIQRIQQSIQKKGYAITSDQALGFSNGTHDIIDKSFFTDELLGPEIPGLPPHDRLRARDVIEYRRKPGGVALNEYPAITLHPVAGVHTTREYNRAHSLATPMFTNWIVTFLSMMPVGERQEHGTLGLDFLRTFNTVVAYKHQDDSEFIGIYVTARHTAGAHTLLFPIDNPDKTLLEVALQPGECLIFRDSDFMHDASPLEPRFEGDLHYRDVIILSVNYRKRYLQPK